MLVSAWSDSLHRSIESERDSVPKASNRQVCLFLFFCFCHFGSNGKFMLHTTSSAAIFAQMVCFLKFPLCVSRIQFTCCRTPQKCVLWLISHFQCHSPHSFWFGMFFPAQKRRHHWFQRVLFSRFTKVSPRFWFRILIQNSRKRKKKRNYQVIHSLKL